MLARISHRVRQFFGALNPRVTVPERADAYGWLSAAEQRLFESMTLRDQQHGIHVLRHVRGVAIADDPPLFAAALLHDVGKGKVTLWQRVLHVLLPDALEHPLAAEHGASWRRAFWRLRYHPDIGAELAEAVGSHPDVVRLIREQDHGHPDERLALLQAADRA
jgi:hypothetical protein